MSFVRFPVLVANLTEFADFLEVFSVPLLSDRLKTQESELGFTMTEASGGKDQQHPLHNRDRPTIDILLAQEATDYNLAELARLWIRYQGFPGARDIQQDLNKVLQRWGLTEAELFAKTRQLHDVGGIYKSRGKKEEQDWN